jgi:hypothetical protein
MKITSYAVGRPVYYDRNMSHTGVATYAPLVAPHAEVTRSTITIAAGKKGFVDFGSLALLRDGAATTAGLAFAVCGVQPLGGSQKNLLIVPMYTATLGVSVAFAVAGNTPLVASDVLNLGTADASTGGTIHYMLYTHVTLFDA